MPDPKLFDPATISALNETLKIVIGAMGGIAAAVGAWITVLSRKTEKAAKSNTEVTAVNTEALTAATTQMADTQKELVGMRADAAAEMKAFRGELKDARDELKAVRTQINQASRRLEIGIMKIHHVHELKLSRIPEIDKAIERLQEQVKEHEGVVRPIIKTVQEKRRGNGT